MITVSEMNMHISLLNEKMNRTFLNAVLIFFLMASSLSGIHQECVDLSFAHQTASVLVQIIILIRG